MTKRVVVTGMGGVSPIGTAWTEVEQALRAGRSAVHTMPDWDKYEGLNTRLGARAVPFEVSERYSRKRTRSMGRVALMATWTADQALRDAGLSDDPILQSGRVGVAYGSSSGSPPALSSLIQMLLTNSTQSVTANSYVQMMPHTTGANVSVFFGICGRMIPTSSACTSGSLAIGMAYEAIQQGKQTIMLAGGAEELSVAQAAVFDVLYATSTRNDCPTSTPRPFDADRDGMVVGEGAATLVLEELEHARARGATIHAEIVGFGTNSDGRHFTQPSKETMAVAMRLALDGAGLTPDRIGYVNAHGTATGLGDIAESHATREIFGRSVPFSSLKSYFGHTLGACGSIEAWMTIEMMKAGWFAPTINLRSVDKECADLDYIIGDGRAAPVDFAMSNNFAFGGVNTSLIFRRGEAEG
ncbi:MAG: beta-ketoacyl-ACP synthase [Thalassobaculaceae bacterium]|nr:beta-ketoacyl-ACP synthase [Thalassobaculaceae bacterium]